MSRIAAVLASPALMIAFALGGATTAGAQTVSGTRTVLGPQGTVITQNGGSRVAATATGMAGGALDAGAGATWVHESGLEGWVGRTVSLGNGGSQVVTKFGPFGGHTRMFAASDVHPPTPVWEDPSGTSTYHDQVVSADSANVHVTLHNEPVSGSHRVLVNKYSSNSVIPDWTYVFPITTNGHEHLTIRISRDGQSIVAVVYDAATDKANVATLRPWSSTPASYAAVTSATPFRGVELSADGRKLLLSSPLRNTVLDTASGSIDWTVPIFHTVFDSHAMSPDGSFFAQGSYGQARVYKRNSSGNYDLLWWHQETGSNYCDRMAISDDGRFLAAGFLYTPSFRDVRLNVYDLQASNAQGQGVVRWSILQQGGGSLQNKFTAMEFSANGSQLALGYWGDEFNQVPELMVLNTSSGQFTHSYQTPGSVMDVDFAPDGARIAAATKAVHANTFGGGGDVRLYELTDKDVRLFGAPSVSQMVDLEFEGPRGSPAVLLWTTALASTPFDFGAVGTLHLERTMLNFHSAGATDIEGVARTSFQMPPVPLGSSVYFQGFTSSPRRLTGDFIEAIALP